MKYRNTWVAMGLAAWAVACAPFEPGADVPEDEDLGIAEAPLRVPGNGSGEAEQACLDSPLAKGADGHHYNRFMWCKQYQISLEMPNVPGVVGAIVNAQVIAYGRDDRQRSAAVLFRVADVEYAGLQITPAHEFLVTANCDDEKPASAPVPSACDVDNLPVKQSLADWEKGAWQRWTISSNELRSGAANKLLRHGFWIEYGLIDPQAAELHSGRTESHTLRCDSALYFKHREAACIIDGVTPVLQYSAAEGSSVKAVADHILKTLGDGAETYPGVGEAKSIPGAFTSTRGRALHRVSYKGKIWRANQLEKDRACQRRAPYRDNGLPPELYLDEQDCDEFPFASTAEGASNGLYAFSVLGVDLSQNRCAGTQLKNFYLADRILYSEDPFYVQITEDPGGPAACSASPDAEPSDDDDGAAPTPIGELPLVDAGPDRSGDEGSPIQLAGSASDAEGSVLVSWSYYTITSTNDAKCSFADANAPSTTFTCTNDGEFEVVLTVDDGVNEPQSDSAHISVKDVPATVNILTPTNWQVFRFGETIRVFATVSDPGDDVYSTCYLGTSLAGEGLEAEAVGSSCEWQFHPDSPDLYRLVAGVDDGSGGAGNDEVGIVVYDPTAGSVNANGSAQTPPDAWSGHPGLSEDTWFHLAARYYPESGDKYRLEGSAALWLQNAGLRGTTNSNTQLEWLVVTGVSGSAIVRGKMQSSNPPRDLGFVFYTIRGCRSKGELNCADGKGRFRSVIWDLAKSPHPDDTSIFDSDRPAGYFLFQSIIPELTSGEVSLQLPP